MLDEKDYFLKLKSEKLKIIQHFHYIKRSKLILTLFTSFQTLAKQLDSQKMKLRFLRSSETKHLRPLKSPKEMVMLIQLKVYKEFKA